jgi:hypothetical protein
VLPFSSNLENTQERWFELENIEKLSREANNEELLTHFNCNEERSARQREESNKEEEKCFRRERERSPELANYANIHKRYFI